MTVIDREEFTPTGGTISKVVELHDDGRVVTTVDGNAVTTPATAATIARAARIVASQTTATNEASLRTALATQIAPGSPARNAMTGNTTYLAIGAPNAAQNTAQIRALTNQNRVIIPTLLRTIRVLLGALDADS